MLCVYAVIAFNDIECESERVFLSLRYCPSDTLHIENFHFSARERLGCSGGAQVMSPKEFRLNGQKLFKFNSKFFKVNF